MTDQTVERKSLRTFVEEHHLSKENPEVAKLMAEIYIGNQYENLMPILAREMRTTLASLVDNPDALQGQTPIEIHDELTEMIGETRKQQSELYDTPGNELLTQVLAAEANALEGLRRIVNDVITGMRIRDSRSQFTPKDFD